MRNPHTQHLLARFVVPGRRLARILGDSDSERRSTATAERIDSEGPGNSERGGQET
ncbi:hypothetical protein GCM10009560_70000 [Nonomuraea longicatena]|uniref:Uncharacterized protein n=1 Tax=Nonomuraea longicatena TaxID=83682 RepID=A0ABN1R1B5_9ACTN